MSLTTSDTLPARSRSNIGKAGARAKAIATDGQECTSANVVPLTTEVLAAAVLHDVVEDAGVSVVEIEERFGARVAAIVAGESEDKREGMPPGDTWKIRKMEGVAHIAGASDPGVRMVCLGDKLSNIRAIQRDYEALGDALWQRFNQKDPAEHAWYYSAIADALQGELGRTDAWREYRERVAAVFSDR